MQLAFDTATPYVTVALHDGESVVAEARSEVRMKHGEHLAAYKVPRIVQFVEQVPITASGKIVRRLLKDFDDGTR